MPREKTNPGDVYGRLTVIKRVDNLWGRPAYLCQCSCGNTKVTTGEALRCGNTKSCGCYNKEFSRERQMKISEEKKARQNIYTFNDDVAKCTFPDGRFFLIDAIDYEEVSKYLWHIDGNGYVVNIRIGLLHRFLMDCGTNIIDHVNRDRLDNRRSNLRICNQRENTMNCTKRKRNTTGYKGVYFDKRRDKYYARLQSYGRTINLGYFNSPVDAAKAYDVAAIKSAGKFAYTNFPRENYEKEVENQ